MRNNAISRRTFLNIMGASVALAGLAACTPRRTDKIVAFVAGSEEEPQDLPLNFATASTHCGYAKGVLVRSHMGRPVKVEGNPEHPASLGASDVFMQAWLLNLYDPDRSRTPQHRGMPASWDQFRSEIAMRLPSLSRRAGDGLRLLVTANTSPTRSNLIHKILAKYPQAAVHFYEPFGRNNIYEATRIAFGAPLELRHDFTRARAVVALDSDFFIDEPGSIRYARDFIAGRRFDDRQTLPNSLFVTEPTPTTTGTKADQRLPASASRIEALAFSLANRIGAIPAIGPLPESPEEKRWLDHAAAALLGNRNAGIVIVGPQQSVRAHLLAHAINSTLGNIQPSGPIEATEPIALNSEARRLPALVRDMSEGRVNTILIVGGNPVFTAPSDLGFTQALRHVPFKAHLSSHFDETSAICDWHLPLSHELESWSDARGYDGTTGIIQPLIEPLWSTATGEDFLSTLLPPQIAPSDQALHHVKAFWQTQRKSKSKPSDFEHDWKSWLQKGSIPNTRLPAKTVKLRPDWKITLDSLASAAGAGSGIEIVFRPDPRIWDGSYANNSWLQELPQPLTQVVWDNPALIHPETAKKLGVKNGDVVEIDAGNRLLNIPVWLTLGQNENSITLHAGYGRTRIGRVGEGVGYDVYPIRTLDTMSLIGSARVRKTGARQLVVSRQAEQFMEGRDLVRIEPESTATAAFKDPTNPLVDRPISLYPNFESPGYAWAMSINLSACIGCATCTVACQAENNIPVVGKREVNAGRIMHWIRIDAYHEGPKDNPNTYFQPVPCMHCEKAPCEYVCPVMATTHSEEGLNEMTYNRCVGTRYCSNNCPYKVRRFNFFQYSDYDTQPVRLQYNPSVTVRSRGVMEKCTYCVQRINEARIRSERDDRRIKDGEVTPACAQACPTNAIVFGDLNDPSSRVARLKKLPHSYGMLTQLGTRPRTTYLAVIKKEGGKT